MRLRPLPPPSSALGRPRVDLTLLLVLAALPRCHSFVPTAQNYDPLSPDEVRAKGGLTQYVWTTPTSEHDTAGLGGGLSYAWDPTLCDELLPNFGERSVWGVSFVDCHSIRAAMERAFASWEANHPIIQFHDISNLCRAQNATPPALSGCALAEIWITNNKQLGKNSGEQAATTLLWTYTAASPNINNFHFASGVRARGIKSIARATMGFSVDICWYLDSTFCSQFHSLKSIMGSTEFLDFARIIFITIWLLIMLETLYALYRVSVHVVEMVRLSVIGLLDTDGDGEIEWHEVKQVFLHVCCCQDDGDGDPSNDGLNFLLSEEASAEWYTQFRAVANFSACVVSFRIIFLVLPPIFWFNVFLPCWECFDFEAAASHEVGHVLGMYHPDQAAPLGRNYMLSLDKSIANNRTDPETGKLATSVVPEAPGSSWSCTDPWANVAVNNATKVNASLMKAFTQTPSGVCVFQDDLDGLNTLYPACTNAVSTPQCWKSDQYLGLVRLTLYVGIPTVVILLLTIMVHSYCVRRLKKQRDRLVARNFESASVTDKLRIEMEMAQQGKTGKAKGAKRALATRGSNAINKRYGVDNTATDPRSMSSEPPVPPAASMPQLKPYVPDKSEPVNTRPPLPPAKTAAVSPSPELTSFALIALHGDVQGSRTRVDP
ncbi:hypothetical protein AB1Y20_007668 [Prymnesium parvum]|uniref:EF-hand domain-containing protein n=1 Tax=Prymnesium parvum TaxID=97485 RepID=A0AB34IXL2_PRYPA